MSKIAIVVPAFKRPEFLYLCLEHIFKCPESKEALVYVSVDNKTDQLAPETDILEACSDFPVIISCQDPHSYPLSSYNMCSAMRWAYNIGADYTFLLEEDVMVLPDFIRWHLSVQRAYDLFASVARYDEAVCPPLPSVGDPVSRLYFSNSQYTSPGACLKRESLEVLLSHCVPAYFADNRSYVIEHLGETEESSFEQDGLTRRLVQLSGKLVAFPYVSRAYHMGFRFYNKLHGCVPGFPPDVTGSLMARVAGLRQIFNNAEEYSKLQTIHGHAYLADLEPYKYRSLDWKEVY